MRKLFKTLFGGASDGGANPEPSPESVDEGVDAPAPVSETVIARWEEDLWELESDLEHMELDLSEYASEHPPWEDMEREVATGLYLKSWRRIPEDRLAKKWEEVQAMRFRHAELPALIVETRARLREMRRKVGETPVDYLVSDEVYSDWSPEPPQPPSPSPPPQRQGGSSGTAGKARSPSKAERFAVIDTETTGFSKHDRVVEIACVTVVGGEIVDEYDTLVQPNRDLGAAHVHGITPEMVQAAPTFDQVLPDIAARINGAVLAAHNISFDVRMLAQEVKRVDGAMFAGGDGICTYRLTGTKLSIAAAEAGLGFQEHTALGDARLVAGLLARSPDGGGLPASCAAPGESGGFTLRRPGSPQRGGSLHELALRSDWPDGIAEAEALYLDVLDRTLDDGVIKAWEAAWLADTATAVGISEQGRADLHASYYNKLVERILADGIVTNEEALLSQMVAHALNLEPQANTPSAQPGPVDTLEPGLKVCFTGEAAITRAEMDAMAARAGLEPVSSVTKKCGLLVAADPLSQSGKARTARKHGIPVIDADKFTALANSSRRE